jgi:hypothetical protein
MLVYLLGSLTDLELLWATIKQMRNPTVFPSMHTKATNNVSTQANFRRCQLLPPIQSQLTPAHLE